jgi:hypothetical protein
VGGSVATFTNKVMQQGGLQNAGRGPQSERSSEAAMIDTGNPESRQCEEDTVKTAGPALSAGKGLAEGQAAARPHVLMKLEKLSMWRRVSSELKACIIGGWGRGVGSHKDSRCGRRGRRQRQLQVEEPFVRVKQKSRRVARPPTPAGSKQWAAPRRANKRPRGGK